MADRFGLMGVELLNAARLERTLEASIKAVGERRQLRGNGLHAAHRRDVTVRIVG